MRKPGARHLHPWMEGWIASQSQLLYNFWLFIATPVIHHITSSFKKSFHYEIQTQKCYSQILRQLFPLTPFLRKMVRSKRFLHYTCNFLRQDQQMVTAQTKMINGKLTYSCIPVAVRNAFKSLMPVGYTKTNFDTCLGDHIHTFLIMD